MPTQEDPDALHHRALFRFRKQKLPVDGHSNPREWHYI
jgi:hypothetical protein